MLGTWSARSDIFKAIPLPRMDSSEDTGQFPPPGSPKDSSASNVPGRTSIFEGYIMYYEKGVPVVCGELSWQKKKEQASPRGKQVLIHITPVLSHGGLFALWLQEDKGLLKPSSALCGFCKVFVYAYTITVSAFYSVQIARRRTPRPLKKSL